MQTLKPQSADIKLDPHVPQLLTAGDGYIPPTDKTAITAGDFPAHDMYGDDKKDLRDETHKAFEKIVLTSLGDTASRGSNIAAGLPHSTEERVTGDEEWDPAK